MDLAPFVSAICSGKFPGRAVLLLTLMKRFQLRAKQRSYLQPDIWGSEAVRQSGRDSLRSHHIPTESWEDSGRLCSETPLIHRSDRLKESRWMAFIRLNSGFTVTNLQAGVHRSRNESSTMRRFYSQYCRCISTVQMAKREEKCNNSIPLFHIHTFVYKSIYFFPELSVLTGILQTTTVWSIACRRLKPKALLSIV